VRLAGTVKDFAVESPNCRDWTWPARYLIPRETLRGLAPHGVFALCAIEQALADAGLTPAAVAGDPATGLFCASAGSAMLLHHHLTQLRAAAGERGNPMGVVSSISGTLNFNLGAHFRITGAVCGFVSACASSSHALGYACDEIRLGRLRRVLVVGAEEPNADTLLPFAAMRALSTRNDDPAAASRPYDKGRDGFVMGEGAGCLVLESEEHARARGARIYAEVASAGITADGHHIAQPDPEGKGATRAMRLALEGAGATAADVIHVNAHATSTPQGDVAEAGAIRAALGGDVDHVAVSGTKSMTGHLLGGAGAVESVAAILALYHRLAPVTANLEDLDDEVGLDVVHGEARKLRDGDAVVLNNSFGFGGHNVALAFRSI